MVKKLDGGGGFRIAPGDAKKSPQRERGSTVGPTKNKILRSVQVSSVPRSSQALAAGAGWDNQDMFKILQIIIPQVTLDRGQLARRLKDLSSFRPLFFFFGTSQNPKVEE